MDPIIGTGLSIGGNLLQGLTGASAARKQNKILGEGTRQQNRAGMESAGVMADFLSQLRGSRPNPSAERGAFSATLAAPPVAGPITGSRQFAADSAAATSDARGYGSNLADLFARIRAPQLQRQNEAQTMVRMGDALRPIQMRSQDDEFLTNLRAGMKKPNPWLGLLGQGMTQAGNYMVSNG